MSRNEHFSETTKNGVMTLSTMLQNITISYIYTANNIKYNLCTIYIIHIYQCKTVKKEVFICMQIKKNQGHDTVII